MVELFYRSYSSVYVHYIPIKGYESCGATGTVVDQTVKLSHRIRSDAERVQSARAGAWMRFDTKQLSVLISSAFKHLASGRDEPFDFSQCRERLSIPNSTEEHFSRILGHCLRGKMEEKFEKMGMVMASSLLRHAIHEEKSASVFNKEIRALCDRAVSKFLDDNAQCAYVNPSNGRRCVNTKSGHAQGHQDQTGACLSLGFFISSSFDSQSFLAIVEKSIGELMNKIDSAPSLSRLDWQRRAAEAHRENLKKLRELNGFPWKKSSYTQNDFGRDASVCYACFFGRPEYRLPCGHAICVTCLEDFDSDQIMDKKLYPGVFTHSRCIICDATGAAWPYRTHVKPRLAGVRVLSLDGGGVRGVVELVVLRELEKKTGLGIPLGRFFDFIIGTSAGGIISLGIGIQDRTADDCLSRFHEFTRAGFTKKWLNKTRLFRPVGRLLRSSIYSTPELEGALQNAFRPSPAQDVFGLRNPCRVAVTTTANRGLMLIANYNRGNDKRYLHSDDLAIWKA
ncbi:Calcium-independent phospholipase A2-gamma [Madurella mycetomatis]|uniref:Calcium-independent phospholipase A2-gamma n=1 Tax=Madurella mycetomatis TaxID=100816 RepID=A0A175W7Y0_9PEZI|nr:Calcium-independent phospholipase A2-gamma [Madurella mycetomatis]